MSGTTNVLPAWTWAICLAAPLQPAAAQVSATWNGGSGSWTDATQWSSNPTYPLNGQPTAGDTYAVTIASGNVYRNVPITLAALNLTGGLVYGPSAVTVTGAMSWSAGVVQDGDLVCNGGLAITGSARLDGSSTGLTLAAGQSASITGAGTLALENQAKLTNHGTFYARNNATINEAGPYQSEWVNDGTFTRDSAGGTFTVGVTQFGNSGTLNVNSGTLELLHGITNSGAIQIGAGATLKTSNSSIFNAGSSFSGSGQWLVQNGEQHLHLSLAAPNNITLASTAQLTLYDGHTLTLNGALAWSGGTLGRESSFFGGTHGYVTLNGGASIAHGSRFYGLTLTNTPTSSVVMASGANLSFGGDAMFQNAGNFTLQGANAGLVPDHDTSGNAFSNSGVFTSNADVFNTAGIRVGFDNSGTVNATSGDTALFAGGSSTGTFHVAAGALLHWSDGDYAFHAGTAFTGTGNFEFDGGTQTVDASLSSASTLDFSSSLTLAPGVILTSNGMLNAAGSLDGGGTLLANGSLGLSGGTINGSMLENSATSTATHRGLFTGYSYTLSNGGVFLNHGTFLARDATGFNNGSGSGNTFVNAGTFTRDSGTGDYTIAPRFNNTGAVNVNTGTLKLSGGGTSTDGVFQVAAPAKIQFSGNYTFDGGNSTSGAGLLVLGSETAAQPLATHTIAADMTAGTPLLLGNSMLSIAPGATFTATGPCNVLLATITGGGTLHAGGGSSIGQLTVDGATLSLAAGNAHTHASGSDIILTNGAVLDISGSFQAQGDHGIRVGAGAGNGVHNTGTFIRNTGGGIYTLAAPLNNSGTVSAQSGTLLITGGAATGGSFDASGGLLQFTGDYAFSGICSFTGAGTAEFLAGTNTITGPLNATCTIALSGGALTVQTAQTVTSTGPLIFGSATSAGYITGGGTFLANGGITLNGGYVNGATLANGALQIATHNSGPLVLVLQNGGAFNNAGSFLAQSDSGISGDGAVANIVRNSGSFIRNTGLATYQVDVPFENTHIVNIETGTLAFTKAVSAPGGTFHTSANATLSFVAGASFDSTTVFTGGGNVTLGGGSHSFVQSTVTDSVISLTAGEISVAPAVTLDSNGFFHWAGGTISGGGTVNAKGGLDLTNNVVLADSTLNLAGGQAASQTGTGRLVLNGSATLNNAGTYHASNDSSVGPGSGSGWSVNNSGTWVRDTGSGIFTVAVPFHNTGTVDVQSGTLTLSGGGSSSGTYQVAANLDLVISGDTSYAGDSAFTGSGRVTFQSGIQSVTDSMASAAIVNLSGGTLSIAADQVFSSAGEFHWSGGTLSGGGTLQNTGLLQITGAALPLDGATLQTSATGISSIEGAGLLVLSNGAVLNNEGTFSLLNNNAISAGDASAVHFDNSGTLNRDYQTDTFYINVPFNHSGTLNLNTGALSLNGGGTAHDSTITTQAGTALNIGTSYTFGDNNVIIGSGAVNFSNGVLHVTGSLTSDAAFNWNGGSLDGGGTFTVKGGLAITPAAGNVSIVGTTLENALGSEAIIGGSGYSMLQDGGTFRNAGTARLQGNFGFVDNGGSGNAIYNSGTLIRDAGSGGYAITLPIHNTGTIRSNSGSLYINQGGSSGTSGGDLEADGGSIYLNGGNYEFNGGALTGADFVILSAGQALVTGDTGSTSGPATGGFGIAGGSFGGSSMLSVDHGYLSTGTMTGTAVLRFTGVSSKPNYTTLNMAGGTIRNDGVFNQSYQANYDMDVDGDAGGGTIQNNGDWNLANSSIFYNTYGEGVINNAGNFNQAGGGNFINAAFNNQAGGSLNATAGYIELQGGGSQAIGATLNANGGSIYFNGGTHVLNGGAFAGGDFTYDSAGTVVIAGNVGTSTGQATGGFSIAGGTLRGTASLSADHGYLASGTMMDSVRLRFTGASSKANYSMLYMSGGTIQNDGSYSQSYQANYDLDADSDAGGGTIQNNGEWNLTSNSVFYNSNGEGVINNAGSFNQAGGGNFINAPFNNQAGASINATSGYIELQGGGSQAAGCTLNADGGSIYFNGGTHVMHGGAFAGADFTYDSAGTVVIAANVGADQGPATGGFGVAGGTLRGSAIVSADHGYFSSGTIAESVLLRFTGASSKENYSMLYMSGGTIQNDGSYSQSYQANYDLDADNDAGGGTIQNYGAWNLTSSSVYYNSNGEGVINNAGNFNQAGGGNVVNAAFNNQSGGTLNSTAGYIYMQGGGSQAAGSTLNANGGSIYFNGGTHVLNGGAFAGTDFSYDSAGTVVIAANVGASSGPATGGFGVAGGTLRGSAIVSADHGYFSSGTIADSVVLRFTGASSKENYTTLGMTGGTIQNDGSFSQNYQGNFDLDTDPGAGGGTIQNNGAWNLTSSNTFSNSNGGGVINNTGNFNQLGGYNYIYAAFNNQANGVINANAGAVYLLGGGSQADGGTLNADGGSIYFNGGTHNLNGGSLMGGSFSYVSAGLVNINHNVGTTSGSASGGFGVAGGTLGGSAMLSADHGYFSSGTIQGTPVLRFTGASTKENYTSLGMAGGTIQNDGSFSQNYQGNFDLDTDAGAGGGTIQNNGTWNLTNSNVFSNSYGGGVINNAGNFNQLGGTNYIYAAMVNSGTLTADGGTVYLLGGSIHSGALVTNSGIVLAAGTHSMAGPAAYLGGSGELYGNLTISDGASICPGNSVGTLTLYGEVSFVAGGSSPACLVELAGAGSSDQINLANGATLDLGSNLTDLRVSLRYAPAFGDSYRIVSAGGSGHYSGSFRNLPNSGSIIAASYGGQSYSLQISYSGGGKYVDLAVLSPYQAWAFGKGLTGADAEFGADPDHDGIVNGIEFVIGGEPNPANPGSNSQNLLPLISVDATSLRVVYRRNVAALYLDPGIQYDGALGTTWTPAQAGINGVTINVLNDGFGASVDRVEVRIPRSNEIAGKLFARLTATQ